MTAAANLEEIAAAEEAVAEAEAAEAAASSAVNFAREERAAGRMTEGDLHRARKALARAQEATEGAKARSRVLARDEAARRALEQANGIARWRQVVAEAQRERDAFEREKYALLASVLAPFERLDKRINEWTDRVRAERPIVGPDVQLAMPPVVRTIGDMEAWGRVVDGVQTLIRLHSLR